MTQYAGINDFDGCLCWLPTFLLLYSHGQLSNPRFRCDIAEVSLALAHSSLEEVCTWLKYPQFSNRPHKKTLFLRLIVIFQVNSCVSPRDARTPLHLAAALGNLPITQLLIWVSLDFFIPFKLFCFSQFILIFVLNGRNVYVGILF